MYKHNKKIREIMRITLLEMREEVEVCCRRMLVEDLQHASRDVLALPLS
jgi:hypothetical protein